MKYYPAFLDLRERTCLVIGGGAVAERKTLSLLAAGAEVTVVSPGLTPKLRELATSAKINYFSRSFEDRDIIGAFLVIAATDSAEVNTAVARLCRARNILVNVVSPPDESSLIVPSVVERGDLVIAVSTTGISPALSRKIRQELEERYGREYEVFLKKLAVIRKKLRDDVPNEERRRSIFQAIIDSDALFLIRQNRHQEADRLISKIISEKSL